MNIAWEGSALDELADIWLHAPSNERRQVTTAASDLEARLRVNPGDQGESRPHGRRVLYAPRIAVPPGPDGPPSRVVSVA